MSLVAALSSACSTLPAYQPPAGQALAPVKLMGFGRPQLCKDGKMYALTLAGDRDTVFVPVGERIGLGLATQHTAAKQTVNVRVTTLCTGWVSFVPKADRAYLANSFLSEQGCLTELVRVDPRQETGVAFEESLERYACAPSTPANR